MLAQFKGCSQICCFDLSQPGHATRVALEPALGRVSDRLWFCFPSFLSGDSWGPCSGGSPGRSAGFRARPTGIISSHLVRDPPEVRASRCFGCGALRVWKWC